MTVDPPTYRLVLTAPGPNRLKLILELRALRPDLTLEAAKALVDGAPGVIVDRVGYWDLEQVLGRLTRTGAVIETLENEAQA